LNTSRDTALDQGEAQMTRTLLAIATAVFSATALFAPAAEACISCNYTPEVIGASSTSHGAKSYDSNRAVIASKALAARLAKERAAKAQMIAKKVETAKTAPVQTAKFAAVETQPENETKTVATASPVAARATPDDESKVAQDVGCKKFISAIGMTVTVPCQ
jgi:hypothetical protein